MAFTPEQEIESYTRLILQNDPRTHIPMFHIPEIAANLIKIDGSPYDGDTFHARAVIFAPQQPVKFTVRLRGIDTPEIKTSDKAEHDHAVIARNALSKLLPNGSIARLSNPASDKYGRLLADVINSDGINVSQYMIDNKFAHRYDGGTKEKWTF